MSIEKKTELWGTFSVKDHLRKRPFVADVLLYDRLMIPRPPTPEENAENDEEPEVKRWGQNGWAPKRQRRLLDILAEEDLAVELPWNKRVRQDWYDLYHGSDANQIAFNRSMFVESTLADISAAKKNHPKHDPYYVSGGLIAMYIAKAAWNDTAARLMALAQTPGVDIEPVVAYNSYRNFKSEQSLQPIEQAASPQTDIESLDPYAMFGWDFFVPEDTEKSDDDLLRQAVKLASRADLREARQSFHAWLRQMYDGKVDPEDAQKEMVKMLKEYSGIVRGSRMKTIPLYVAKVTKVLAPLSDLVWQPPIGSILGVAAGGAELVVEWLVPTNKINDRIRPAAFVHNARRFFGKK